MNMRRFLVATTWGLCVAACLGIGVLGLLGKDGRIVARFSGEQFALSAPLVGIAACANWWRRHRWLPFVGLAFAALGAGASLWGNASDYLEWSRAPRGQEAMYFGGGLAMLFCWALCLGYVIVGTLCWLASRRAPMNANPLREADADVAAGSAGPSS